MISSLRGLMSTPGWPPATANAKAQDVQAYQTAFAPIALPDEAAGGGVAARAEGGLDWVKRAAEANIEKARQMIWSDKPAADSKPAETAADYKTAFSAYFDE